jgi:hypothetical protein
VHLDGACFDLSAQRLIGAEQQLLTGLATGVEGAGDLRTSKRSIVEQAAVLTREGHALRHALINDVDAHFRQAIDICLTRTEVSALDRVMEKTVDAVTVIAIILGRIDAPLRSNAVRPPGAVLKAEAMDVVSLLAKSGGLPRPPASPLPTTMTSNFRRFEGLTSLTSWR